MGWYLGWTPGPKEISAVGNVNSIWRNHKPRRFYIVIRKSPVLNGKQGFVKYSSSLRLRGPDTAISGTGFLMLPAWLMMLLVLCGPAGCSQSTSRPQPPKVSLSAAEAVVQQTAQDSRSAVRADTVQAVENLHRPLAEQIVAAALHDASRPVRFAAAMVAGRRRMKSLEPQLKSLLHDPDPSVRIAAVYALARLGDSSHMNMLPMMLTSSNPVIRANAAMVLGRLGDASAIGLLRTLSDDPNHSVKLVVTSALARLGYKRAIKSLIAMDLSGDTADHLFALSTCRSLDNPLAVNVLLAGLHDPMAEAQLIAARGLGQRGSVAGIKIALTEAASTDPGLRALAALALGSIPSPASEPALRTLLQDKNIRVRVAAAAGLINLHDYAKRVASMEKAP